MQKEVVSHLDDSHMELLYWGKGSPYLSYHIFCIFWCLVSVALKKMMVSSAQPPAKLVHGCSKAVMIWWRQLGGEKEENEVLGSTSCEKETAFSQLCQASSTKTEPQYAHTNTHTHVCTNRWMQTHTHLQCLSPELQPSFLREARAISLLCAALPLASQPCCPPHWLQPQRLPVGPWQRAWLPGRSIHTPWQLERKAEKESKPSLLK